MLSTRQFINDHSDDDVHHLLLQAARFPKVDMPFAVRQIEGRQKMRHKVPLFHTTDDLLYPARVSLEQASSQLTATYKASLCRGRSFVDLTGGLGIDCYFISGNFETALYVEREEALCEVARHNFSVLGAGNIEVVHATAEDMLRTMPPVDCIFVDPSRRDAAGRKRVLLSDCSPDVGALADALLAKSKRVMVKLSPMMDIAALLRQLPATTEVHIVAVDNECKEILLVMQSASDSVVPSVHAVNLEGRDDGKQVFTFSLPEEAQTQIAYTSRLKRYLYEPNAAIMKGGAFKLVSRRFGLEKLHPNTHLYTADCFLPDFPGRVFEIVSDWGQAKKKWKVHVATLGGRINVVARNYPLTVNELKKRLKLSDGGSRYLFACTSADGRKFLIECERLR